jgi:hypothetical protein
MKIKGDSPGQYCSHFHEAQESADINLPKSINNHNDFIDSQFDPITDAEGKAIPSDSQEWEKLVERLRSNSIWDLRLCTKAGIGFDPTCAERIKNEAILDETKKVEGAFENMGASLITFIRENYKNSPLKGLYSSLLTPNCRTISTWRDHMLCPLLQDSSE